MKECKHCGIEWKGRGLACSTCRAGLNRYNMNRLDMIEMHKQQDGKCKLCNKPVTMFERRKGHSGYIDHCHSTNVVRGVLCHPCNTSLGYLENNLNLGKLQQYLNG